LIVLAALLLTGAGVREGRTQHTVSLSPPGSPPAILQLDPPQAAGETIRGVPFTGAGLTVVTQVLADGNRLERRYTSRVARDSAGRFRQELEVAMLAMPSFPGPAAKVTTISDPVSGFTYILDESRLTARRAPLAEGPVLAGTALTREASAASTAGQRQRVATTPTATPAAPSVRRAALGQRQVEGVLADGLLITVTFPPGSFGNQHPVVVVTERWISSDLKVPVRILRKDPRIGESVYTLSSIARDEPPASLFAVPANYKLTDEPSRSRARAMPASVR
jgi:hypothetical protein